MDPLFEKFRHALLISCVLCLAACFSSARAQSPPPSYTPCLGCAQHNEIVTRWHRPFLAEVGTQAVLTVAHFSVEARAQHLGLCETDPLLRTSSSINGCHSFSLTKALLLATPLEVAAFTSPSWGLARMGHTRMALTWNVVPIVYHSVSIHETNDAIGEWRQYLLLH